MSRTRLLHIRSSSLSTLAVQQPAAAARPVRLPSEAPKQSQHSQLALGQPTPLTPPLFPCTPPPQAFSGPAPSYHPAATSNPHPAPDHPRAHKRPRLRYRLDAGAYGIPKQRPSAPQRAFHTPPASARAVQVGEDAYFVRADAIGVADGVGGWARGAPPSASPTPSALFARRLMHFCAAEVAALDAPPPPPVRPPAAPFLFEHHLRPRAPPPPEELLDDALDDLADGIDVLRILERAYDSTVRVHAPLATGSSTALLAVLDHLPAPVPAHTPALPAHQDPPEIERNYAVGALWAGRPPTAEEDKPSADAVVHIAHLGDCMGMLVRGDSIAWRSDEMWSGYNRPLQLGPPTTCPTTSVPPPTSSTTSPSSPQKSTPSSASVTPAPERIPLPVRPHTFALPVRADDILILASDGLGDNLWDEDVLDEVVRAKRGPLWAVAASPSTGTGAGESAKEKDTRAGGQVEERIGAAEADARDTEAVSQASVARTAFAGQLAEALCSRAQRVAGRRGCRPSSSTTPLPSTDSAALLAGTACATDGASPLDAIHEEQEHSASYAEVAAQKRAPSAQKSRRAAGRRGAACAEAPPAAAGRSALEDAPAGADEVPFARRAALAGRVFRGGKCDDISVLVAVISPAPGPAPTSMGSAGQDGVGL
ncbi:hypothetical protein HYPSUDRAFT_46612 [Hypholoma sublateritium FD-334 SS-4]|uniref:Protein phosphatase n=1 Tax=Hypholoma sublateritium (strain FD-334 SS-4) TaxID=945553 RepID=A0A0D2KRM0_HYPSF|nr:hypothetical protein HYPSUDRAFT_46612 [Hypholoma sublateritium FD-334 SS-4]